MALKGDPEEAGVIKQTVKSLADRLLPHRR
jgi:hypothetical protein